MIIGEFGVFDNTFINLFKAKLSLYNIVINEKNEIIKNGKSICKMCFNKHYFEFVCYNCVSILMLCKKDTIFISVGKDQLDYIDDCIKDITNKEYDYNKAVELLVNYLVGI